MAVDAKTGQPIFGRYNVGLHNVGSYQSSGKPFITGSAHSDANTVHMVEFPSVCKSFTVINTTDGTAGDIRVHFQSGSVAQVFTEPGLAGEKTIANTDDVILNFNFITVQEGASVTMDVKCKQFYISTEAADTSYQVFAELTNIPTDRMYHLTGSGITT
jgi:hypothetical protein|tara:strand:- start:98 stop:574 length:477 start_codon:yes stop_codon:yes gene_type:complete